jgi:hypothetical protein
LDICLCGYSAGHRFWVAAVGLVYFFPRTDYCDCGSVDYADFGVAGLKKLFDWVPLPELATCQLDSLIL